jgi:Carboxypeptidase regulatory-like domain
MGDVDVLEQGVDLTRGGPGPLEVILSGKAPGVSGSVKDDKDKPVADATVALVPREAGRQGQQPFYRTAKTDRSGNFTMSNLAPGEYRLYSWAEVVSGAWVDPEFLRPLDRKAKPVTLGEGGSQKVELKVIPAEQ